MKLFLMYLMLLLIFSKVATSQSVGIGAATSQS